MIVLVNAKITNHNDIKLVQISNKVVKQNINKYINRVPPAISNFTLCFCDVVPPVYDPLVSSCTTLAHLSREVTNATGFFTRPEESNSTNDGPYVC